LKNIELQQPGRNFYLSVKYNFIKWINNNK
jgi:hypothetical protein